MMSVSRLFSSQIVIAHEVGHAWRDEMGLDIKKNDNPYGMGSVEFLSFKSKKNILDEFEGLHFENIIRSELKLELREIYGTFSEFKASDRIEVSGKEYTDFSKANPVEIRKDKSYDYNNAESDHYENLKTRKHEASEIDINKNEPNVKDN